MFNMLAEISPGLIGDSSPVAGVVTGFSVLYLLLILVGVVIDARILIRLLSRPIGWTSLQRWMYERPWSWSLARPILLTLICAFASVTLLQLGFLQLGVFSGDGAKPYWLILESMGLHGVGLGVILLITRRNFGSFSEGFGSSRGGLRRDLRLGTLFYVAVLPAIFVWSYLYESFMRSIGEAPSYQYVVELLTATRSPLVLGYFGLLAMVIAPLVEELLFRGIGLPLIAKKLGFLPAALIVSAVFAVLHGHSATLVPLFILSMAFCFAYAWSKSMLVPVVMHALFNGVNVVMLFVVKASEL